MATETDVVAAFCAAARHNDVDGMVAALAPDAELISPLSSRIVIRGRDDLRIALGVIYGSLTDLRWTEFIGSGSTRVAVSEAGIGRFGITDAMIIELAEDGRIRRIRPHLRPWLGTTVFALLGAAKLGRYPGLMRRALRPDG
ncbi:nuclear transport factor 2 family protein [Nocardia arthritidis]|uniref:Nuclear transport factor 2 family protein n=1 Tax=Nocardia arthritidis TaxID=228602 RepID=A0A6G9Y6C9_9NOCA|nr:nuclear transport factor 2 family protein [Nocardia arthritidis]QIS08694.1 nuclear transport factor 2 family protein [Nocardia arthritidis]